MSPDEDLGPKEAQVLITMLSYLIPHLADQTEVLIHMWKKFPSLLISMLTGRRLPSDPQNPHINIDISFTDCSLREIN